MLSTVFEHDRVFFSTQKNFRTRDAVECSNVFLSAENNPGVILDSTEHAKPLFIAFRRFFLLRCSVLILSTVKNQSNCESLVMNNLKCFNRIVDYKMC